MQLEKKQCMSSCFYFKVLFSLEHLKTATQPRVLKFMNMFSPFATRPKSNLTCMALIYNQLNKIMTKKEEFSKVN